MFFNVLILLAFSSLLAVNAQSSKASSSASHSAAASATAAAAVPTSTAGIPPCVLNCTTSAATKAGCSGITDVQCVCTNQNFQSTSGQCLQASCSAADQAAAKQLQSSICASVSAKPSGNGTASATAPQGSATGGASSAASGAASGAASASASKAAASALMPIGFGGTHAVGAVGVALAMVAGAAALF